MSELNLKEIERRFVVDRVKGRTLYWEVWISQRPEDREAMLEAYGLYRCELAVHRLLAHTNAALEALGLASRSAGGVAVEARRRVNAPAPADAPRLKGAEGLPLEELAERMDAVYRAAKRVLPKALEGARIAAGELSRFGCIPEDLARGVRQALAIASKSQDPKHNYRWWLPETAHALLLAAEGAQAAWGVWRLKAGRLEEKLGEPKRATLSAEDLARYKQARALSEGELARLHDTLARVAPKRER